MKLFNWACGTIFFLFPLLVFSHHYKGLPHFSYFENYPQIPYLEFIKETPDYEVYVTVYNFQGLNLEQVEAPDSVRIYLYIYDIKADKVYKNPASFKIFSHNSLVHATELAPPEQENIFVIQKEISKQDDLVLTASFKDPNGKSVEITIPFQITKTFFQKFGLYIVIALFFLFVIALKLITGRNDVSDKNKGVPS